MMAEPTDLEPGGDVFSEADLAPSEWEIRARRRALGDKAAATVAITAVGLWIGGLIALGACAAPFVFQLTPYPFSGQAMGAAFARFDAIAIGCAVVALGAEVARTLLGGGRGRGWPARIRRYIAIAIALGAVYQGMQLTPKILDLHQQGARRNVGADGVELERIHRQAEMIGKVTVPLAVLLIGLHVFTLRTATDEEDEPVVAPGAPGAAR